VVDKYRFLMIILVVLTAKLLKVLLSLLRSPLLESTSGDLQELLRCAVFQTNKRHKLSQDDCASRSELECLSTSIDSFTVESSSIYCSV